MKSRFDRRLYGYPEARNQSVKSEKSSMSAIKLAIVTMAYNEPDYIGIWRSYYGKQVGDRNLFIVDHGSDDGSTSGLGDINVMRIPRSPQDDILRAGFLSKFCSSLLDWYDCVMYVDIDEIAVPDPRFFPDLLTFCGSVSKPILNAIGINVIHRLGYETAFDPTVGVLSQRSWAFRSSSMCKPILIRRPVVWAPGFHSADAPAAFEQFYLFHLRWFDLDIGLRRLAKTRVMPWQHADAGRHQKISNDGLIEQFTAFGSLQLDERDLDARNEPVSDFIDAVLKSQIGRENDVFRLSLDIWPDSLWHIPERFRGAF